MCVRDTGWRRMVEDAGDNLAHNAELRHPRRAGPSEVMAAPIIYGDGALDLRLREARNGQPAQCSRKGEGPLRKAGESIEQRFRGRR